jgi:hypothetical protein
LFVDHVRQSFGSQRKQPFSYSGRRFGKKILADDERELPALSDKFCRLESDPRPVFGTTPFRFWDW